MIVIPWKIVLRCVTSYQPHTTRIPNCVYANITMPPWGISEGRSRAKSDALYLFIYASTNLRRRKYAATFLVALSLLVSLRKLDPPRGRMPTKKAIARVHCDGRFDDRYRALGGVIRTHYRRIHFACTKALSKRRFVSLSESRTWRFDNTCARGYNINVTVFVLARFV